MHKPTISVAKSGLTLLAADMCGSTQLKTITQDKLCSIKTVQLHNAIVKAQVEGKGKILKELGDEVIAFFGDIDSCLQTARQIQEAFNLYNLLFSAHKLHTKIAIVHFRHDDSGGSSLFGTTSSVRSSDGEESLQVYDLLGADMDRLARILEIAKPDEILLSEEILNYLNGKYRRREKEREMEFEALKDDDPARRNFLRGVGRISLGQLKWSRFPQRPDLAINMEFPEEAVVAFHFNHITDCLGEKKARLLKSRPSGLRFTQLEIAKSDSHDFTDMLLIGQSLGGWAPLLNDYDYLTALRANCVRLGVVAMSGDEAIKALQATTPESEKLIQDIERSVKFFDDVQRKPESKDVIDIRYAPTLVADAWSFYSNKARDLFSSGIDIVLPYEQIIDTYVTSDADTDQVMATIERIKEEYEGNLSIEWCIHDVLLGVNPEEALSTLLSLDWFYALTSSGTSQYLLARIKAQHMFVHSKGCIKAPGAPRD